MNLDLDSTPNLRHTTTSSEGRAFTSYSDSREHPLGLGSGTGTGTAANKLYEKYGGLERYSSSYLPTGTSGLTGLPAASATTNTMSKHTFEPSSSLLLSSSSNLYGPTRTSQASTSLFRPSTLYGGSGILDQSRDQRVTTTSSSLTKELLGLGSSYGFTSSSTTATTSSHLYTSSAGITTTASGFTDHLHPTTSTSVERSQLYSSALDKLITSSSSHYRDPQLDPYTSSRSLLTTGSGTGGTTGPSSGANRTTVSRLHFGTTTAATSSASGGILTGGAPKSSTSRVQSSLAMQHPIASTSTSQSNAVLQQMFDDMRLIEDTVDSIEIPARGRCRVYMAKYGYDPFKESPNDEPDKELAFNAGDYIMVFTDLDEDGYFIGELMDGRRGYVPSNWLERLTGEDLFEFQASVLYKQAGQVNKTTSELNNNMDCGDQMSNCGYPPEFYDLMLSDSMNHSNFQHLLAPEDYHRMNDYVNLDDVNEVDDECLSDYERAEAEQSRRAVPPPQRLTLERQLLKSILVSWLHPHAAKGTITSYQIYVDGVLKSTVPSGDRCKALLEGVDSTIPHRVSVRAIDFNGHNSNDAACTVVIGQKIPFAPSCVKASHITSDSALISWLPCNSNFHHVVAVNSVEVQTVRPGVYKHLINGLSADTLYRVWVRAKPGKILSVDEKNPKKLESLTTFVDFKTMPKSLPDPPVNVQVEAGPQRRTLLVTWLPLTLNDYGTSNGCPVTGYAVFAGHKKLADIDSPTGDHALLDLADLDSLHKKSVTVRTKSGENLSQDSMACQIPDEYLKSQHILTGSHHQHHSSSSRNHHQGRHSPAGATMVMKQHPGRSVGGHQRFQSTSQRPTSSSIVRGRQLTRSLQNLESDLDSRRSSVPAIEVTQENSHSDSNQNPSHLHHHNPSHHQRFGNVVHPALESYSEEEFETSMRLRGPGTRGRQSRNNASRAYRARQSHSMDSTSGQIPMPMQRYHGGSLARLRDATSQFERDRVRFFVAQFDYDPSVMSPNPNATTDELCFKEGAIIKVYGDKGLDGFYRGEVDGRFGFVPCNVISEIRDPNTIYQIQEKEAQLMNAIAAGQLIGPLSLNRRNIIGFHNPDGPIAGASGVNGPTGQQVGPLDLPSKRMAAMYDYDPWEHSPNADTESEIAFKKGDIIIIYGKMDTDGFYMGEHENTKKRGLVPSNFLCEPSELLEKSTAGGPFQPQFNQQGAQMDPSFNQMNSQQQQQQQQQQPMNKMNLNQPIRANMRTVQPNQQMQQQQQQQLQSALIRAPNVNMGANQQQMMMQGNVQQPMQNITGQVPATQQTMMMGGANVANQQQQFMMNNRNQMQPQQQQQQQQQGGGVLSNLLSSGKQMIGAATTIQRNPNQQQAQMSGQYGMQTATSQMNLVGQQNQMMGPINMSQGQQQQQVQQQIGVNPQLQQQANGMIDGSIGLNNIGQQQAHLPQLQQQQQPMNRVNLMQPSAPAQFNPIMQDPMQQQQTQFGQQIQPNQMNPLRMGAQVMPTGSIPPQQQQQQQFVGMGQQRPLQMNQQMGEEQGGNILSHVKNMFKL